jgi:hypothetical protein
LRKLASRVSSVLPIACWSSGGRSEKSVMRGC